MQIIIFFSTFVWGVMLQHRYHIHASNVCSGSLGGEQFEVIVDGKPYVLCLWDTAGMLVLTSV